MEELLTLEVIFKRVFLVRLTMPQLRLKFQSRFVELIKQPLHAVFSFFP